jgi:hypothetical protein
MIDPTTIDGKALRELVRCPPAREGHVLREQASPSALQQWAACRRSWGHRYLEGRKEVSLSWAEAEQIPEPPKPEKGWAALAKAEAEDARKAWNKLRRPALGTEVHAILGAWMLQHTPGAWHPPMAWREIDWTSAAGRVARPACDVLPDPRGLVAVYTELAAEVEAPPGWAVPDPLNPGWVILREWPRMPGFYDLITVEVCGGDDPAEGRDGQTMWHRYRLWDFKTTSSFDWAKTEEELREDPQVLLYALHAMQTFGLEEIECNWVYLLTDPEKQPKHYLVTVTITRAEAEAAAIEMAETACEVMDTVRLYASGRLRVVDLERDVGACKAYGGCLYHVDKSGPCDAKVSPGKALKQKAALEAKITARKSARKVAEKEMALSFAERKAQRDAAAKGGAAGTETVTLAERDGAEPGNAGTSGEQAAPDAGGGSASAASSPVGGGAASAAAKPRKARVVDPAPGGDSILAIVNAHEFAVPVGSALGKALVKASKALAAAAAAFEGE